MPKKTKNNEKKNSIYVVTFELYPEKWQKDIIDHKLSLMSEIYDDFNRKLKRIYHDMTTRAEYKKVVENRSERSKYISSYTIPWVSRKQQNTKKENNQTSTTETTNLLAVEKREDKPTYKKGETREMRIFTQYGFATYSAQFNKPYKTANVHSGMLADISGRLWSAWEKFLFGKAKKTHYTNGDLNSWTTGYKNGGFLAMDITHVQTEHLLGIKLKNKQFNYIPFKFSGTPYEIFALQSEIREITIKREMVRGTYKYYVQFAVRGIPYGKGRNIGKGTVGIDLGVSTIAVCADDKVLLSELAEGIELDFQKIRMLQRKIDRSRRANNPDNYNEDGTIRRPARGTKMEWKKSARLIRLESRLKELQRRTSAKRKLSHTILANNIMSYGDRFLVENNNFAAMQKRSKETKTNEKGKNLSKKRFGKTLMNHAPAAFITILDNKVKPLGGSLEKIDCGVAATQFDFTSGEFNKHSLSERHVVLSNGNKHQRDLMAAYNIKHLTTTEPDEKKVAENYDIIAMNENYEKFCKLERKEIKRIKTSVKNKPSSFGL